VRSGSYVPFFVSVLIATNGFSSAAIAQPNCADFFHNADGSWSPQHPIMMDSNSGPKTMITPESRFRAGVQSLPGLDLGKYLDINCGGGNGMNLGIPRMP
jgi:hypothetical protein